MKAPLGIAAIAILGSFLFALPASAGTIQVTYTNPGGPTIYITYKGSSMDVYTFPYMVSGAPMMCDDAQTDVQPPLTWWAQVNYLPTNLSNMKWYSEFTPAQALVAYEEAAIIFYEGATGSGVVQDGGAGTNSSEGNVAVWYLFSPGLVSPDSETLGIINAAYAAVQAGTDAYMYSQVVFITPSTNTALNPNGINQSQEFIALGSEVTDSPEPATYAMFGAGLPALGWLSGRLRRV